MSQLMLQHRQGIDENLHLLEMQYFLFWLVKQMCSLVPRLFLPPVFQLAFCKRSKTEGRNKDIKL